MLNKIHILLVALQEELLEVISEMFSRVLCYEFAISIVPLIEDARIFVKVNNVDLVLLDLYYPDMLQLSTVKKFIDNHLDIPVIALSRYNTPNLPCEAFSIGISDFLLWQDLDTVVLQKACFHAVARSEAIRKEREQAIIAEKHRQEERDKAQRYLDIAGTMIVVLSESGHILLINKRGCEILGYDSAEELIGKNWFDTCILPEDRQETQVVFNKVLNLKNLPIDVEHHENKVVRKDGLIRLISWHNSYLYDGTDIVSLSSGEDITNQRKIQKELERSEKNYRLAVETAGEGIAVVQDGIICFVNNRLTELLGYRADYLIGRSMFEFLLPEYHKLLEEQHKKRMKGEDMEYMSYNVKGIHESGDIVDLSIRVNTIEWEGRPAGLAFISDITDRLILQERQLLIIKILKLLNTSFSGTETIENLLKLIQDFTGIEAVAIRLQEQEDYPYFVYKGFPKKFIEMENKLCIEQDGCTIRDNKGRALLACMCGCVIRGEIDPKAPYFTKRGSFWSNSTTELLKQNVIELSTSTRNKCNEEGYESVAIIPLSTGPEIIGTLQLNDKRPNMFTYDFITFLEELALSIAVAVQRSFQEDRIKLLEIAKTRDLLESSRLLNSGIAHELRTPLQAILNCLELISFELDNKCQTEFKEIDYECPKRRLVNSLVKDGMERTDYSIKVLNSLSEYSKIASSEEIHLINVVLELKTIMRTLMFTDLFKSMDEGSFVLEVENTEECRIKINKVDFSQLLTNLCNNAREAIQNKDPHITVKASKKDDRIQIKVIDNGKGIDPSFGNKIFEPYFSTKEVPGGRNQGLGLAMVRDIVAAYGGKIHYISEPGHTEFIVDFDCEQDE